MMVKWAYDGLLQANASKMFVNDGEILINGEMLVNDGEMSAYYKKGFINTHETAAYGSLPLLSNIWLTNLLDQGPYNYI